MPDGVTPGLLTASVGALVTFLAAFLTWASVEVTSRIGSLVGGGTRATSGLEGDRLGKATLVLALAALALCVLLIRPSSRSWGWIALAAVGGLIVVLALLDLAAISDASDLRERLARVPGCSPAVQCTGDRTAGIGVYLTIVGGLVVLVGALLHHGVFERFRLSRRSKPAAAGAPATAATPAPTESETSGSTSPVAAAPEPTSDEPTSAEPTTAEATTAEPETADPETADPASHGPASHEPAVSEPPAAESPVAESATAEPGPSGTADDEAAEIHRSAT